MNENELTKGVCRICGCTDDDPCFNPRVGNCWWIDETHTLCSHCADEELSCDPETRHCINSTFESDELIKSEGYEVQPFIVPAAGKDSFQERKRVWIVACLNSFGSKKDKVTSGEHFKAFRQTKKQLPDCIHFESWVQSLRYYSGLDGVVYGIPNWMDRTHALGNAIDPRVAYEFLITIDYLLA
jgi:hypothetical protein